MHHINDIDTVGPVNLASLDLNLLVSLDALLSQRSVTRAAAQVGLSQPALSASLARLRRHFGDELLIRVGNEYRLSPLAVQLRDLSRIALAGAERVFAAQQEFRPASSTREFSLLVSDYAVSMVGGALTAILAEEAPHTRLRLTSHSPSIVERADLVLLSTDLLLMPHGFVTDLAHQDVYLDEWVCVVAETNPVVEAGLTIDALRSMPWVATYHGQTASTPAARHMRMLGIEPRVQVVIENFANVAELVADSDRIALLQRRLFDRLPPWLPVRALPCPVDVGPLVQAMWWHPVFNDDPAHIYLRSVVARAGRELAPIDALDARSRHAPTG